jgi:demethylmenaquinone methyltransferase / 2-methoxy-6-polyprenyl-1,4-benzoquinol methylase
VTAPPLPPSEVARMFDRIHQRYDFLNRVLSLGLDAGWRRRAVAELTLLPGDRVIDLCCGTGDLSQEILRAVTPGGEVVGVDFAPLMLDKARQKLPQLQFLQGDVLHVPLPDHTFEAAAMAFGPRNIHDLQALWREMRRLVRPGGRIMTLECTRPPGILGVLHRFYLAYVLPVLGSMLAGDGAAYNYLARTVRAFLNASELSQSMREGGLLDVRTVSLHGGIVTVHVATVPPR